MSKTKIAVISLVTLLLVGILGTVAVLTAMRQNTTAPVAPTVPQAVPHAQEPTTTATCSLTFTVTEQTHKECQDNACATVSGAGTDSCSSDTDCITYKYNKCETGVNNAKVCKQEDCSPKNVNCSNQSTCQSDSDCQPHYQHKVCLTNNTCGTVDCSPNTTPCSDSCSSDSQCQPATPPPSTPPTTTVVQTHRACVNNACTTVSGAGADSCTSDVTCAPKAVAPAIPKSGNEVFTIGGLLLGAGSILVGVLLIL
ncbi:MAG: hypothetical protein M1484_05015 [Patescibacteria group bacterium]|nr:hypothetical protein [Patescibacteria group bacterium]